MEELMAVTGALIYAAAIEGAKRNFERTTDDYSFYELMLHTYYELMFSDEENKDECDRYRNCTNNNWRNSLFPITLIEYREHRSPSSCEIHARVCLKCCEHIPFDIPMRFFKLFKQESNLRREFAKIKAVITHGGISKVN